MSCSGDTESISVLLPELETGREPSGWDLGCGIRVTGFRGVCDVDAGSKMSVSACGDMTVLPAFRLCGFTIGDCLTDLGFDLGGAFLLDFWGVGPVLGG